MATVLIPHGITPTGVGIRLRSNGSLRPLSPCCGERMLGEKDSTLPCKGCNFTYGDFQSTLEATLGNDVSLTETSHATVQTWLAKILGIPGIELNIS